MQYEVGEFGGFVVVFILVSRHAQVDRGALAPASSGGAGWSFNEAYAADIVDVVDHDGAVLPLDFGGEGGVRYLGIYYRGLHAVVAESRAALAVGSGGEQQGGCTDGPRHSEKGDHGVDGVDSYVHERAAGVCRVEGVGQFPRLVSVVSRRVLAVGGEVSAHGADAPDGGFQCGEVGVEGGLHRFHQHDSASAGGRDHLFGFGGAGGEGLLAEHVLAVVHAEYALVGVAEVRGGDVDRVDPGVRRHFLEGGEALRYAVPCGEGLRPVHAARAYGRDFYAAVLPRPGYHPVGYEVGADHTQTDFFHG